MPDGREQYAEKLLGAVNEAAAAASRRFAAFLTVCAYVAITVASTTDEMLVKGASLVKLPILDVQIPLTGPFGFYTVAPWLIVLMHSDLLLQLSALGSKIFRFQGETDRLPDDQAILLRERMASFYYVQYLSGRAPSLSLRLVSGLIMLLTVVLLPLVLQLWLLVRFLPFHSGWTWLHRSAVFADAALVFWLWWQPSTVEQLPSPSIGWIGQLHRFAWIRNPAVLAFCVLGITIAFLVEWFPGDQRERGLWLVRRNLDLRERVLTTNSLPLSDINALRGENPEQWAEALQRVSPLNSLQGRDLRYANLWKAILPGLDLRALRTDDDLRMSSIFAPHRPSIPEETLRKCADRRECNQLPECEDPVIIRTQLGGADLRYAVMADARLDQANLEGANLSGAWLQHGSLPQALLNHASLQSAKLPAADLKYAKLCDVSAPRVELDGADLSEAILERADLTSASLQGANLHQANLRNADLSEAALQGADLSEADLSGAKLVRAQLQGAIMRGTVITDADLTDAATDDVYTRPSDDAKSGRERRDADLLDLACANADVARGLSRQAVDARQDRPGLAAVLLSGESRPDCRGIKILPAATKEGLRRLHKHSTPSG